MYINDKSFDTNLIDVNKVRYLLFTHLYNNPASIDNLTSIIGKYIECLGINYDPNTFTFTIKIKKTAMRRIHGFKQDPSFYYIKIPEIFREFLSANEGVIMPALQQDYPNPKDVLNTIYLNYSIMANLCHVSCIADNIVIIKL